MSRSNPEIPPIPLFTGEKYEHWSVKMKILLQCQGLWEFVESGYEVSDKEETLKENRMKDATALSYIQQGLSDDHFDKIIDATTAKEAWDILNKEFKGDPKENDNHRETETPPMIAYPPVSVPMHQMPSGYHNYPVAPFHPGPSYPRPAGYPDNPSQQGYFYPSPTMQVPPGYPTYPPPHQHGGGFGRPPPMQSAGGGLVGKLGKVASRVEQMSGVKISGALTGQQMGAPMGGQPPVLPPQTLAGGPPPTSLPPPECQMPNPSVPLPPPPMPHISSGHTGSIIGKQFVSPQPINLRVTRKLFVPGEGNFDISGPDGNLLFTVKGKLFTMHDKRTLYDNYGNPLVTFCSKSMSIHHKWFAFRGDSTRSEKLFTAKRSSLPMRQVKASLDVTLNDKENGKKKGKKCDFKVKGGWFDKSFTVYSADTNSIVAEMSAELNLQSIILDKDTYVITVKPNIDYAFISSLLVIFDGIVEDDKGSSSKYKMFLRR